MHTANLKPALEAILFMNHKPITLMKIQELIDPEINIEDYRTAVSDLMATYFSEDRGIELVEVANGLQLRTKMEYRELIQKMFAITPMKLTSAMLEVLAITAYNQPITREKIDQIRGVDSSHLMRTLLDKKMLRIVGKSEDLGKPLIYGTTKDFLEIFGLRDLNALPSLRDIEEMLPANEVGTRSVSEEEALAEEMAIIVEASKPIEFNDIEIEAELEAHEQAKTENSNSSAKENSPETSLGEAAVHAFEQNEVEGSAPKGPEGHA